MKTEIFGATGPTGKPLVEQALAAAMKKAGVKRLITVIGAGVTQPGDEPKAFNHFMSFMLNLLAKDVIVDSSKHAEIVRASGLDWTIVRVPMLTDGERKGQYRVGKVGVNDGPRISRADVADFVLRQLSDKTFIGQAPVISY